MVWESMAWYGVAWCGMGSDVAWEVVGNVGVCTDG